MNYPVILRASVKWRKQVGAKGVEKLLQGRSKKIRYQPSWVSNRFKQLSVGFLRWYLIFRQNPNKCCTALENKKLSSKREIERVKVIGLWASRLITAIPMTEPPSLLLLTQVEQLTGIKPKQAFVDKGLHRTHLRLGNNHVSCDIEFRYRIGTVKLGRGCLQGQFC